MKNIKKSKWIKVEDELPTNEFAEYNVCLRNGMVTTMKFITIWYKEGYGDCPEQNPVTHWRRLPSAPLKNRIYNIKTQ